MYEQDWLNTEYDSMMHLNTNASAGRTWLMQMGTAAARNDLTIQYCMSWPRHIMQSVEIPAVTNARASYDYHPDSSHWYEHQFLILILILIFLVLGFKTSRWTLKGGWPPSHDGGG